LANEFAGGTAAPVPVPAVEVGLAVGLAMPLPVGLAVGLAIPVPEADAEGVPTGAPPWCLPNADWLMSALPWLLTAKTTPSVTPSATGIASGTAIRTALLLCVRRRRVTGRWPVSIRSTSVFGLLAPGRSR
jgi:hypothetical protein